MGILYNPQGQAVVERSHNVSNKNSKNKKATNSLSLPVL